jgi:hypothetical protein
LIPKNHTGLPAYTSVSTLKPAAGRQLLQPLYDLVETSDSLTASSVGIFKAGREEFQIPRFVFMGPTGGGDTIRLGLFSTLHGDETEGAEALVQFFQKLEWSPGEARGFHLYAYPVCNPSGLAAARRTNFAGRDLVGEFWRKSKQPEAYYLEREMGVHRFQGVISLHTGKNSSRFVAATRSFVLDDALVKPALQATQRFIPGLVHDAVELDDPLPAGFLTGTDELSPAPFEINLRIPRQVPKPSQIHGTVAALKSVLNSYRTLMALKQNL